MVIISATAFVVVCITFNYATTNQIYLDENAEIETQPLDGFEGIQYYQPVDESYPEHHFRIRRQVFGGINGLPRGGRTESFGYKAGPAWASMSQSFNSRGFSTPITYSAGAEHTLPAGHGISGTLSGIPGQSAQGNIRGQLSIFNTPDHQVTAWAQHDKNFDKNLRPVGPGTNSAGLNYQNQNNGATAFISGSQTPGFPKTGSVGGSIPLFNKGNTRIDATGQTNFGQGMKPNHQVGIQLTSQF